MRRMGRFLVVSAAIASLAPVALTSSAPAGAVDPPRLVLGAEDNRLIAYDPVSGQSAVALPSAADDPVGGLDINAQICEDPANPGYVIAGEDTDQGTGPEFEPGWGYLHITGSSLGDLAVTMEGNLVPTYGNVADNPENYGCGFLPDGRLVTTDVGDQQPFAAANGQLIVWFPDGDGPLGFDDSDGTPGFAYCKVDVAIPTAGGIYVDGSTVYLTANRPGLPTNADLGGVYRYTGLPTSPSQCTATDATGAPLVPAGLVTKTRFITGDPLGALTPSAIVRAPGGGFFVSSVLTGVIAEYDQQGRFVRRILDPPAVNPLPPHPDGTPYGMTVDAEGSLWYADIGVVISGEGAIGPGDHNGSVRRIRFVDGDPLPPEVVRSGLMYPDGMGTVQLAGFTPPAPADPTATSQWGCGDWGMYGAGLGRTFSTTCPTSINTTTARTLVPAWTVRMPRTMTAAPAVVGGTVYVGDWSGTMYALRATNGSERWRFRTESSPGAAFGPIVSSAAVADVRTGGSTRRLVIFGAGPRVYAVDANTGTQAWVVDRSNGLAATTTEFESSPVVHGGVVYIGVDTHNAGVAATGGQRGGLLALDATDGTLLWEFNPELAQVGVGCGSVWSSPTVDVERGTVLLATGNCTADAASFTWNQHTEALTALDLDDGSVRWTFQPHAPNRADLDFGATPNLISLPGGQELVGVGNKDATYYAVDPATGALVWSTQVAIPGNVQDDFAVGGFIGSTATWRGDVFGGTALGGPPWYHALDGADGARLWTGVAGPTYAASAVVNGVVFAGDLTGVFKAFDAANGLPLFAFPLLGPISSAPAVAGNLVVIGSGTSSSDLCAKGTPGSEACSTAFDLTLGSLGSVTAFRPLSIGGLPPVLRVV